MRRTRSSSTTEQPAHFAVGLHLPEKKRTYFFKDFTLGSTPKQMILIGRGSKCDLQLDDPFVSVAHVMLKRRNGVMVLLDQQSRNGVYIDGKLITKAVALLVGMQIQLGHTLLVATDARGKFPIPATSISDLCRKAATLYGSDRLAGKRMGRSYKFIARNKLPREQRDQDETDEELSTDS
jgi:hypothetical protein